MTDDEWGWQTETRNSQKGLEGIENLEKLVGNI